MTQHREEPVAASEEPSATRDTPAAATGDEEAAENVEAARDLSRDHLRGLLEALVFASDKPLSAGELAKMSSAPLKHVKPAMEELRAHYARRGIVLAEVAGGWLFRTNVVYAPFVRELTSERPVKLTRAQVETLAITAYRQPITRPEIDEIRGVDSGATLKLLLERDLLRILGKKDEPGRPLLYGTTPQFLEFFGLKSLKDLPTLREFTELSEDSRRIAEVELGEVLPGEAPRAKPLTRDDVGAESNAPARDIPINDAPADGVGNDGDPAADDVGAERDTPASDRPADDVGAERDTPADDAPAGAPPDDSA